MTNLTQSIDHPPATLTISQLAARHGVSRQAISERVNRLAKTHSDFGVRRDAAGRIIAVPVAQYEELIGTFGDRDKRPPRAEQVAAPVESRAAEASLDHARLLAAQVSAERQAIALAREKRELVQLAGIEGALEDAGLAIGSIIDRLPRHAEDLSVAVGQNGVQGLRVALKKLARELRSDIADTLDRLRAEAPAQDGDEIIEDAAA